MRPLIVVLHERSEQVLAGAARFWDILNVGDPAELVGNLYPILTDAWQLALGIERIGPLAQAILTALARHRTPMRPSALAEAAGADESLVIATARQLYVAGILASEASEDGMRLFLPNELVRLVLRLEQERSESLPPDTPLPILLDRLTDHELLDLAERYGMQIIPAVTTREEAIDFLLRRLGRAAVLGDVRAKLSPAAQAFLDSLLKAQPVPLRDIVERSRGSFAALRSTISELARWGWVWRTGLGDRLAIFIPVALTASQRQRDLQPTAEAVELIPAPSPTATLADLLILLARSLMHEPKANPREISVVPRPSPTGLWYWLDPLDHQAYIAFLEHSARSLGLLRADGTVDASRLRGWLQLSFPEQARRLLRVWRSTPDTDERARRQRILERAKMLATDSWYEWSTIESERTHAGERTVERRALELAWLGVLSLGRIDAQTLAVRTTPWSRWILGLHDDAPPLPFSLHLRLVDQPEITLERPSPLAVWFAARLGQPQQTGPRIVWQVTGDEIAHYLLRSAQLEGAPPEPEKIGRAILRYFEQATERDLPPSWRESFLGLFTRNHPAVAQPAITLTFVSPIDRDRAREALEGAGWSAFPIGARELVITPCEPHRRAQLIATLRRTGFIVEWAAATSGQRKHRTSSAQQRPL
mgnify:FL=1